MTGSEPQTSIAGVPQDPEHRSMATTGEGSIAGTAGVSADARAASQAGPPYDTDRTWTLPNLLSMLRLAGAPLDAVAHPCARKPMVWLYLVLAVGGFTDWLDGYLARAWHQTSRLGQMLDPIADRLYILAVLIGLALREIVPWWLVVIVIGRDVMIASLIPLLKTRGFSSLPVHFLGKAATFSLLVRLPVGAARLRRAGLATAGLGVGMGIRHLGDSFVLVRRRPLRCADRQTRPHHAAHQRPPSAPAVRPAARGQTTPATGCTRDVRRAQQPVPVRPPSATARPPVLSTGPAPDASMDLLNQIIRQPVDPDYALAAARGNDPSRGRWTLGVLAMVIGALFAVAALQTTRAAPALQSERAELISRVQAAEREQDELRGRVTSLTEEIATLRAAALGDDDAARGVESPDQYPGSGGRQCRGDRAGRTDRRGRLALGRGRRP